MASNKMTRSLAILSLLFAGAPLLAQSGAVGAVQPSKVSISTRQDSTRAEFVVLRTVPPRLDSLMKRRNALPIGSAEFVAVDDSIWTMIRAMPQPTAFATGSGQFRVITQPTARGVLQLSPMDLVPQGWFGFVADGVTREWDRPTGQIVHHLVYPSVVAIEPNSPASKAGVRSGDSLVAYNGLDLTANVVNMTQLLTPGRDVTVRLRRDGEPKELVLTVEKAPASLIAERRAEVARKLAAQQEDRRVTELRAAANLAAAEVIGRSTVGAVATRAASPQGGGGAVMVPGQRSTYTMIAPTTRPGFGAAFGAAMINVDEGLASSIKGMEGKRGVFVTSAPPSSPAYDRGLRTGDVILRVEASDVTSISQLLVRLQAAEQNGLDKVKLRVVRAGKTQELVFELK